MQELLGSYINCRDNCSHLFFDYCKVFMGLLDRAIEIRTQALNNGLEDDDVFLTMYETVNEAWRED